MMPRAAVLLLFLAACGGFRSEGEPNPDALRLCIQNQTAAYGSITARAGLVRYHVQPGEEVCKSITGHGGGSLVLRASTIGGGASGPLSYATTLHGWRGCWRWRLTDAPGSANDLMPCQETEETEADTVPADSAAADAG
jgi:hypothetical protein